MMFAGLLLIATLIMRCWPETLAAGWLQRTLVEQPLQRLAKLERRHLIFLVVMLVMLQAVTALGSLELATLTAIDVSAYLDTMATVWTVAAISRSRGAWTAMVARLPKRRVSSRPRQRRTRSVIRLSASNDDDGPGDLLWRLEAA